MYRQKFDELNVNIVDYPHKGRTPNPKQGLEHCHGMLDKMEQFVDEDRMDKVFRWLGFLQGVLWIQGIYTLDDLKKHNMPD